MVPELATNGYIVAKNFLDRQLTDLLYKMLLVRQWRGEYKRDAQIPHAFSFWGDSTLDALLVSLLPEIEVLAGNRLLPTYGYARLSRNGDRLHRHHDREACEVAATIHLGSSGSPPPPICFAPQAAVTQGPGDAVVYLGQLDHWRDEFAGTNFGQVFLNYVRADGRVRHLAFDQRKSVFPPSVLQCHD
jgi:hypothetical protein